jgi:tetratricopeptide (TPR) repeat protein
MLITSKQSHAQCWEYIRQGEFDNAVRLAQKLAYDNPTKPEALYTLSYAYYSLKLFTKAIEVIDKAIDINKENAEFIVHKATCLISIGSLSDAIQLAISATHYARNKPEILTRIGIIFQYCDEFDYFLSITEKVYSLIPNDVSALSNYSEALRFVGRYKESEDIIKLLLKKEPNDANAHYAQSQIRKVTVNDNHIHLMEKCIEQTRDWRDKMKLNYALGKEFEDIGENTLAFEYFKEGGLIRKRHSNYDVNSDIEAISQIINTYSTENMDNFANGYTNKEPIFVLGLPRSGTTLVERILSTHTDVLSAGELRNFATELIKHVQLLNKGQQVTKKEMIRTSIEVDWKELGKSYIQSTRPKTGKTARFIDKMPQNYLYIGLIAKALPNAKIILVKRNPLDTCYAMYKTLFGQAYPFTYSLEDIGYYYVAWRKLTKHWQASFPNNICTIDYEELVQNTETQVRSLFSYCDLPWQEECLEFYKNTSGVSTASASQVRQPIYNSSIGKWKLHTKELEPLIKILNEAGIVE